jgi:outer membrane lipoprotein SlyB
MNPTSTPQTSSPAEYSEGQPPAARRESRLYLASWPAMVMGATLAASVLTACGPDDSVLAGAPAESHRPQVVAPAAPSPVVTVPAQAGFKSVAERTSNLGRISSIEPIRQEQSGTTGGVVGGVVGAVIGNQIGSGTGRAAATVAGGVGGALLGNRIQRQGSEAVVGYRVHVQMDDGSHRSFQREQLNGLEVGARVRVDGKRMRVL